MSIIGSIAHFLVERRAKNTTLESISHQLEESAVTVAKKMKTAADTPANREVANHIIGIERWGQSRLDTLFGKELLKDEYDKYKPGPLSSMNEFSQAFQSTRAETLSKILRVSQNPELEPRSIQHNMLGLLSVKCWFVYLEMHASQEAKKIKLASTPA